VKRIWKEFSCIYDVSHALNLIGWGQERFPISCFLNSNNHNTDPYHRYQAVVAIGAKSEITSLGTDDFAQLKSWHSNHNDWLFGFFSYDLKNQVENLSSNNFDGIKMPLMHFFRPVVLCIFEKEYVKIGCIEGFGEYSKPDFIVSLFEKLSFSPKRLQKSIELTPRVAKSDYLHNVSNIRQNIQLGYVYEMNYCVEFYAQNAGIDPLSVYSKLNAVSPTPFSCYYHLHDKYLMSASPERFLRKIGSQLISQPIKGTIRRGSNPQEDAMLKEQLQNDTKERSENIMIVDLVRNDLSRSATRGSVSVPELCGIYSFSHVHQMISTVVAELNPNMHFIDALRNAWPMGSMTGAPKVQAMKLIERYEDTRRGLYSGSVGYIDPEGNFDFNVIIRSILYNKTDDYLSCMAGSAITIASEPEKEFQECLLKVQAMQAALKNE